MRFLVFLPLLAATSFALPSNPYQERQRIPANEAFYNTLDPSWTSISNYTSLKSDSGTRLEKTRLSGLPEETEAEFWNLTDNPVVQAACLVSRGYDLNGRPISPELSIIPGVKPCLTAANKEEFRNYTPKIENRPRKTGQGSTATGGRRDRSGRIRTKEQEDFMQLSGQDPLLLPPASNANGYPRTQCILSGASIPEERPPMRQSNHEVSVIMASHLETVLFQHSRAMVVKGDYRQHPASPDEYPTLLSLWRFQPTLSPLNLLTPTFRLRTASGPATLRDLGVLSHGHSSAQEDSSDVRLYLEILWQHPPSSSWSRSRLPREGTGSLLYYSKLATLLFGETGILVLPRKVVSCNYPGRIIEDTGVKLEYKTCSFAVEYGFGSDPLEEHKSICVFDLLRAIEADRILREEWAFRKKHAGMRKGDDAFGNTSGNPKDPGHGNVLLPDLIWWIWEKRQLWGVYDRCWHVEWKIARLLGIPVPPRSWRDMEGWAWSEC
ncbi:hypothetical protein BJ508DRAFT_346842 [Ascobolus immersus RN42]|uniref:Uncharacterized protein n=1 Tax=Ascobolus immersus RN42 TaxID=1160509 RepID=A0A3N4I8E6_ASCIM|nr:hypothetical protein BJ508DRAFT_346842 [Ascobolus immersus RN42]